MSFPVIQGADTQSGTQASNSTSWTGTYPTNLVSGDLILLFLAADGGGQITTPMTGWAITTATQTNVSLSIGARLSDGTETGNFTIPITASEQGAWRCFRITNWAGSITTGFTNFDVSGQSLGSVSVNSKATGTNNLPNPPNLTQGTAEDRLWFAVCGVDTSRTISVYPLAGDNTADVSGGSTGATLGLCTTTSNSASLDPSTFTISANDDWIATTVLVRPVSTSPPVEALIHTHEVAVMRSSLW